jgi:Spy/CpxP family protein refolding chaperone
MSTKTTAAIALAVVFLAGLVIGVAGDRAFLVLRGRLPMRHGPSDRMVNHLVDRLDRELELTPAQRTTVTAILKRGRDRIDAIHGAIRPQVRAQMDATSAEIEKVLTPEQRTKFAELRAKMERHRERPFDAPPPLPRP